MENDEIDYRKIYMTKRNINKVRVGEQYQAVIPDINPRYAKMKEEENKRKLEAKSKTENVAKNMPPQKNMTLKELNEAHKAHHDYDKTLEKVEEDIDNYAEFSKPIKKRKLDDKRKSEKKEIKEDEKEVEAKKDKKKEE